MIFLIILQEWQTRAMFFTEAIKSWGYSPRSFEMSNKFGHDRMNSEKPCYCCNYTNSFTENLRILIMNMPQFL